VTIGGVVQSGPRVNEQTEETRIEIENRENEPINCVESAESGDRRGGAVMVTITPRENDPREDTRRGQNGENEANQLYRAFRE
jgi:hypothetical protein